MPKISEIEGTPNPNAVKFVLKEPLTWGITRSYNSAEAAADDPLASALFDIPHVTNVFYVDRWVSVTQDGATAWPELLKLLAIPIRSAPAAVATSAPLDFPQKRAANGTVDPRLEKISELIDERIRPALMGDGGDLEIIDLDGNVLIVRYHGACGSCPSSLSGTLAAIENLLRTIEPDIEVIPA